MRTDCCSLGLASVSFRDRSPREILTAARSAGLTCITRKCPGAILVTAVPGVNELLGALVPPS